MTYKQALRTSLIIHAVAFMLMGGFPKGCVPFGGGEQSEAEKQAEEQAKHEHQKEEEIIDKPVDQPMEITIIEETEEDRENRIARIRRKEIAECTPFFGGIGIVFSTRDGRIGKVFKYYPGSDAGLQPGDVILNPPVGQIKGEIGTPVAITYRRGDEIHKVTIVRGRICTRDL